jgi:sec-independent protein translocase protein TatA
MASNKGMVVDSHSGYDPTKRLATPSQYAAPGPDRDERMIGEILGVDAIVVVVVLVIVVFGSSQIPRLARSLGAVRKEFKRGQGEDPRPHRPVIRQTMQAPARDGGGRGGETYRDR